MEYLHVNLKHVFKERHLKTNLEAITDDICRYMITDTRILQTVSKRAITDKYGMYFSRLMRVYDPLEFNLLWNETVLFLESHKIKISY